MSAFTAELVGTMVLIFFGCGVNAGLSLKWSMVKDEGWLVGALAWGFAVAMGVYATGDASNGHLNPAVTLAVAFIGDFPWSEVPAYIGGQFAGAFIGATLVWVHYLPHWGKTEDKATKLGVFSTGPAIRSTWSNLTSEILGTFALLFSIMFIGLNDFSDGLNPLVVGFLVTLIGLALGGTTGYAINPARDLGPRIAHFVLPIKGKGSSDWGYAYVPVVGPIIGGILGTAAHQLLFGKSTDSILWIPVAVVAIVIVLAISESLKMDES